MSAGEAMGDLVATLVMDTSQYIEPIQAAIKESNRLGDAATRSMEAVHDSTDKATQSLKEHSEAAGGMRGIADKVGATASKMTFLTSVMAMLNPQYRLLAMTTKLVGNAHERAGIDAQKSATRAVAANLALGMSAYALFSRLVPGYKLVSAAVIGTAVAIKSTSDVAKRTSALAHHAGDALKSGMASAKAAIGATSSEATTAAKKFDPWIATVGRRGVIAALAYKVALEEIITASARHMQANSELRQSVGGVWTSIKGLVGTIAGDFTAGVKASFMAVVEYTTGFDSLTDIVDYGAKGLTKWGNTAASAIDGATKQAREAALVFGTALAIWHGSDSASAGAFYEEGAALNKLADQTAEVIRRQEAQRDAIKLIKDAEQEAGAKAAQRAELQRIASLKTVEAIDAEIQALKQRVAAEAADGSKPTKERAKEIQEQTAALVNRKQDIESGKSAPKDLGVEKIIEAQQALYRLANGEKAAQMAAYEASGATAAQIGQYRALLDQIDSVTAAKEAERAAEQATQEAINKHNQLAQSAADQVAKNKDEIDLLTGAATKAEIRMRELWRAGYDNEMIQQITESEEALEKLRGKKNGKSEENDAAQAGSSEAAKIVLRGVGGGGQNKMEGLAQKQVTLLTKTVAALEKGLTIEVEEIDV